MTAANLNAQTSSETFKRFTAPSPSSKDMAEATMRTLSVACEVYSTVHDGVYPTSVQDLLTPAPPLIDQDYCDGTARFGYILACAFKPDGYQITATPESGSGQSFVMRTGGILEEERGDTSGQANAQSIEDRLLSPNFLERAEAAEKLRKMDSSSRMQLAPTIVPKLLAALKSSDAYLREFAVSSLDIFENPSEETISALIQSLSDTSSIVRMYAIYSLGTLKPDDTSIMQKIIPSLANKNVNEQTAAAEVLGRYGPKAIEAADELEKAVATWPEGYARAAAITSLGQIGSKTSVPVLMQALTSSRDDIQAAAIRALGAIGPGADAAIAALEELAAGNNDFLKYEAQDALKKINQK